MKTEGSGIERTKGKLSGSHDYRTRRLATRLALDVEN